MMRKEKSVRQSMQTKKYQYSNSENANRRRKKEPKVNERFRREHEQLKKIKTIENKQKYYRAIIQNDRKFFSYLVFLGKKEMEKMSKIFSHS